MYLWLFALLLCLVVLALSGFGAGYLYHARRHPSFMRDVVDFHNKFDLAYRGPPRVLPLDLADFRFKFMEEELEEYAEAMTDLLRVNSNPGGLLRQRRAVDVILEKQLDALVDLTYVTVGTAYLQFGPEVFLEAWRRVHVKNMQKVRKERADDGHVDSGRAAKFDVVKPEGWTPPDHADLIAERHYWPRVGRRLWGR